MNKILSVIRPKEPRSDQWIELDSPIDTGFSLKVFQHPEGFTAFSAVEAMEDEPEIGPEYHLSISKNRGRCTSAEALFVLAQFGLEDAKEDNHVPNGVVRNFWRPVNDKLSGYECPCKDKEPAMIEDKGDFVWRGATK